MAKNRLNFEAHLSRHSHNMNGGYASSLTTGPIVPQYFDILGPKDTLYLTPSMFVRIQDVVTAFFGKIDVHLVAFFVPLQMLYTNFGSVFTQTDDKISSFYPEIMQDGDVFPICDVVQSVSDSNSGVDLRVRRFTGSDCVGKEYMRFLDSMDLNPFCVLTGNNMPASGHTQGSHDIDASMTYNPNITPWIPCAYQAIYQKYYRNEELERFSIRSFNFDRFYQNVSTPFVSENFFRIRYHQRLSDYFTDLRISPIASAVNQYQQSSVTEYPTNGGTLDSILMRVNDFLSPRSSVYGGQDVTQNNPTVWDVASFNLSSVSGQTGSPNTTNEYLNAANIRSLFAVDKYTRIWGRAGKTYDDQILAHFGVKVPHDVKHDITHIKHWQASLTADPIYSTANIPNGTDLVSTLGQVGAQAQCEVGGSSIKFTAPVHGVFMIVAYALTKPIYEGTFSKLHLLNSRIAFPIPEFDKLGAQPLYNFEYDTASLQPSLISRRSGWQNRYEQFKRKYNRCSFTYSVSLLNHHVPGVSNAFAPWILSRMAFSSPSTEQLIPATQFFESTHALDTVMVKEYDASWHDSYWEVPHVMFQTDPLITNFYANAKKVSWMSETGEPDL